VFINERRMEVIKKILDKLKLVINIIGKRIGKKLIVLNLQINCLLTQNNKL
jgi:hypothetical protein